MTVKETVRQIVDRMPDDAKIDDFMQALYVQAKLYKGLEQVENGEVISHEQAKERLSKWLQ